MMRSGVALVSTSAMTWAMRGLCATRRDLTTSVRADALGRRPRRAGDMLRAMTKLTTNLVLLLGALAACGGANAPATATPSVPTAAATAIVAAPDRVDKDRERDAFRKPAELLTFAGIAPGMRVADLGAGGGYTTELIARAVGPTGVVYAQDTPNWDGPGLVKVWEMRLGRDVMKNTTHVMREWDDPLPADAKNLDVITFIAAYHDAVAEKSDENKLNRAVFAALKSGGTFIVVDNSATA